MDLNRYDGIERLKNDQSATALILAGAVWLGALLYWLFQFMESAWRLGFQFYFERQFYWLML